MMLGGEYQVFHAGRPSGSRPVLRIVVLAGEGVPRLIVVRVPLRLGTGEVLVHLHERPGVLPAQGPRTGLPQMRVEAPVHDETERQVLPVPEGGGGTRVRGGDISRILHRPAGAGGLEVVWGECAVVIGSGVGFG